MLDLKQESVINKPGEAGLYLSNKLLTDLEVLNLTRDLQTAEKKVDELDLSYNNLKDRSGVFIGNLIASGYKLKKLKLTGCSIEKDGVQRIFESLHTNSPLKEIDIGLITDFGLNIIAKYVPRSEKLKRLAFQGSSPCA